jgi:NADH-quinone oxidoreductase subunit M
MTSVLALLTFVPLVGVLFLLFLPKSQHNIIRTIGIMTTIIPLGLAFMLYAGFDQTQGGMQFVQQMEWITIPVGQMAMAINFEFGIDGLSLPLVILTAVVASMASLVGLKVKDRLKEFYALLLVMEMGMLGVFTSLNLFQFFVFFEFTIIPMFFFMGIWGYVNREKAALKFLIYNGVGSAILLIVFAILFVNVWSLNFQEITLAFTDPNSPFNMPNTAGYLSENFRLGLFIALLLAFAIKIPIAPFHTWMLTAYKESNAAAIMISSGVLIKIGGYGLIRMNAAFFPEWMDKLGTAIAILGVINILYGAVLALVQNELKLMLAYSSLSHMGIVLLGLAAMNAEGFQGAIFQMVSHGLIAALLFYIIELINERTGTTDIRELGGLAKSMPIMSGVLLTVTLAAIGLPGTSGFVSEFIAYLGLFNAHPIIAAVGTLGIIITAVYLLRSILGTTFGPTREQHESLIDARSYELVPMVVILGLVILIGVYPAILSGPMQETLINIVPRIGG